MAYFRFLSYRWVEKIPARMLERSSALSLARINGIHFNQRGNDAIFLTEPSSIQSKSLFFISLYCIYIMFFNFNFIFKAVRFSSKFICNGKQEVWWKLKFFFTMFPYVQVSANLIISPWNFILTNFYETQYLIYQHYLLFFVIKLYAPQKKTLKYLSFQVLWNYAKPIPTYTKKS